MTPGTPRSVYQEMRCSKNPKGDRPTGVNPCAPAPNAHCIKADELNRLQQPLDTYVKQRHGAGASARFARPNLAVSNRDGENVHGVVQKPFLGDLFLGDIHEGADNTDHLAVGHFAGDDLVWCLPFLDPIDDRGDRVVPIRADAAGGKNFAKFLPMLAPFGRVGCPAMSGGRGS